MVYRRGDSVEVINHEDGLEGSYFEAIIVTKIGGDDEYIVSYRSLLEDDHSGRPLREVVRAKVLRPYPPVFNSTAFRLNEVVDAYHKDAWWKGQVIGRIESLYNVYFDNGDEIPFTLDKLRIHQDWVDARWIFPPLEGRTSFDDGYEEV